MGNINNLNIANNQLTTIDLSVLPNLSQLFIAGNELTSLDFTNLSKLQYVFMQDNQLTNIDISDMGNLYQFNLSNNHLTTLPEDISRFTNMYDGSLTLNNNCINTGLFSSNLLNYTLKKASRNWQSTQNNCLPYE